MSRSMLLRTWIITLLSAVGCMCLLASPCPGNPLPGGGCCLPDGSCINVSEEGCLAMGGVFVGEPCESNPCPPIGACCFADGTCQMRVEPECPGAWMGPGSTCTCNPCIQCLGACCWPDGTCTIESTYYCCTHGGDWNCGATCDRARCATSGLEDSGQVQKASWGKIKSLYRE